MLIIGNIGQIASNPTDPLTVYRGCGRSIVYFSMIVKMVSSSERSAPLCNRLVCPLFYFRFWVTSSDYEATHAHILDCSGYSAYISRPFMMTGPGAVAVNFR